MLPNHASRIIIFFFFSVPSDFSVSSFSSRWLPTRGVVRSNYHEGSIKAMMKSCLSMNLGGDNNNGNDKMGTIELKSRLAEYLKVREEENADEEAKKKIGKVIGGTRGNVILNFVSGSPNKAVVVEEAPNVFDYDELIKYGFTDLVEPIMNIGGRLQVYDLMGMTKPALPERMKTKKAKPLFTREEDDEARYKGLKMNQVVDDDLLGRELEEIQRKQREGIDIRKRLKEESFEQEFADKRNVGPQGTPVWTPEMIDEEGRRKGRAQTWLRKQKAGEFRKDPYEDLRLEGGLRTYCITAALVISFGFGKATPAALTPLLGGDNADAVISLTQVPALAILVAAIGSSVVNSVFLAPERKRNVFVWGVKGLMSGPVSVLELRELEELKLRGEEN